MKKILENEKTVLAAGGRSGFLLNDSDCFYYVREGNLDIFAVTLNEDMSHGARNAIMHLEQGQVCFGFPKGVLQKHGLELFVNGTIDAKVVKIPVAKLKKLANNASHIASVASAIDGWIENASRALSDGGSAPRSGRAVSAKKNQAFEAGEVICPQKGTLWISIEKGNVHFNGIESLPLKKENGFFPGDVPFMPELRRGHRAARVNNQGCGAKRRFLAGFLPLSGVAGPPHPISCTAGSRTRARENSSAHRKSE